MKKMPFFRCLEMPTKREQHISLGNYIELGHFLTSPEVNFDVIV